MFLRLYNFLRGYITVVVSGFAVARFINLAAHRGVYLWDVSHVDGLTRFHVSIKGFRLLLYCAKKSGCRLKIHKKTGIPFILRRYKGRKILALGLFLAIGLIWYLGSFVWLITITGNSRLESGEITAKLSELGVFVGARRSNIVLRDIEEGLMAAFPTMAFTNLRITGTHARLEVVEALQRGGDEDTGPGNVVAVKDGIIHQIATEAGRPLVRPGDVVTAGDILVSGELRVGDEYGNYQSYFVRASSRVTAKRFYEYVFDVPLTFSVKSFTGNVTRNYGIILFDQKIYLRNLKSPFVNYDIRLDENRLSFGPNYPLPAAFFTETFREYHPTLRHRSVEEAVIMGQTIIASRLSRELIEGSEVIETAIAYTQNEDSITVTATVTALEVIGVQRPLQSE